MAKGNFFSERRFRFMAIIILGLVLISAGCSRDRETYSKTARSKLIQPPKWWEQLPRSIYLRFDKVQTNQSWYEVYQLRESTYAIYEPYQFEEAISYLLIGTDKALMVDTGTGIGDLKKLISELTQVPIAVLNTHIHWDQVGNNSQFDEILVYNSIESITKLYTGYNNSFLKGHILGDSIWKSLPENIDPDTWKIPPVKSTDLVEDGMIYDLGNRPIEVIHSPGHSPDSICLLDKKNRLLFCGDFFYSGPLYAFEEDVNIQDYITSLENLIKRIDEFDFLCPSHNVPWVKSDILLKVQDAFEDIMRGKGRYEESENLRRYYFGDFDVIIRVDMIKEKSEDRSKRDTEIG
ncbi:MAG: MBL fold metallo-hydrolase [Candidatus Aminicenantes bacterium]|nr:MAG: MBL fold metallo-hydrolase [Candidatus Aminicenantes bacterium]